MYDKRGYSFKFFLALTPLIAASLIAASRVRDYRHDFQDGTNMKSYNFVVCVGAILGFVSAIFAYLCYFPSVFSDESEKAFQRRFVELQNREEDIV